MAFQKHSIKVLGKIEKTQISKLDYYDIILHLKLSRIRDRTRLKQLLMAYLTTA